MAWIHTIEPEHAEGKLASVYGAIGSARGGVAAVHRAQSLNPRAMRAHLDLYKAVVFARSPLSRVHRERIAVVVSAANRCAYCVGHHDETLAQLGDDPTVRAALAAGEVPPTLAEADRALLRWARTTTLDPASADEAMCERLRALGWEDRCLLDASLTVGYFNFVNRLVLMLGVHLEEEYTRLCGEAGAPSENS